MPWNPEIYNQFKNIRYKPFFDLSDLIKDEKPMKAIDLGCGTGEQTAILAEKFPEAVFIGIDSSAEMLEQSKSLENERLHFRQETTEEILKSDEKWDLIFSNAALQWSDNHQKLFPELISKLNCNGQLAIQMPYQPGNILNQILSEMSNEEPFRTQLNGWNRPSSVLTIDEYVQILFENGIDDLNIFQKVFPSSRKIMKRYLISFRDLHSFPIWKDFQRMSRKLLRQNLNKGFRKISQSFQQFILSKEF
ncbi:methyltransferase domain-containing protein [Chryseobacterium sp. EO14]|uniref:methyltransferase domain-containing protein n=1 Tax=Chryseobacterium sp. EO14 TaxID=2950551 RepID=UPI00351E1FAF